MASPFLIWSNEHRAWWRPGRCGYTTDIDQAGRYDRREAKRICRDADIGAHFSSQLGYPPEIMIDEYSARMIAKCMFENAREKLLGGARP